MTKRRVLVVGYPKSGNTWLTRLAAELYYAPGSVVTVRALAGVRVW